MQRRTLINTKNLFTWKVFFGQAHFNDYLNDAVTHKDILGAKYLMNSINESLRFVDVDRPVFDGEMRLARPRGYFSFCTFPDNCWIFVFFLTIVVNLIKIDYHCTQKLMHCYIYANQS